MLLLSFPAAKAKKGNNEFNAFHCPVKNICLFGGEPVSFCLPGSVDPQRASHKGKQGQGRLCPHW